MSNKNVVDVDFTVLKEIIKKMTNAKENLKTPTLTKMDSYSKLSVDGQINNALNKLSVAIDETYGLINIEGLSKLTENLMATDQANNEVDGNNSSITSSNSGKKSGKIRGIVTNKNVESLVTKFIPTPLIDTAAAVSTVKPTVDVKVQELQNLENYLKKGDLTSIAKSYKFLKTFGSESEAQALLAKYGYKVDEKDGEYIISKITESNKPSINEKPTDNSSMNDSDNTTNSSDNDVIADETIDTETNQNNSTVVNLNNNNDSSTKPIVNNTNNRNNSGNGNQSSVQNTSTEVNNQGTTNQVETDTNTTVDSKPTIESAKDKPKTNVVSITDDSETSSTKKYSGLGTAIPIGLGTIATGAAAVAGVRYVKNRHENQEEYDEDYDDENNNLDNDNEFVDAAQYDDGSSYMDDDYLEPIDNNDLSEDSYVDLEDLEDIEDFSEDSVLEDLNSNY